MYGSLVHDDLIAFSVHNRHDDTGTIALVHALNETIHIASGIFAK
jgi:hypothetical protein